MVQGATHRGSLCRFERSYSSHKDFERIAGERFFTLACQSQIDASPIRLGSLPNQVSIRLKRLDGLRCGPTCCGLKIRECGRIPRERVGTGKVAERHPLSGTEFTVIGFGLHEPSQLQQELCRFAC